MSGNDNLKEYRDKRDFERTAEVRKDKRSGSYPRGTYKVKLGHH